MILPSHTIEEIWRNAIDAELHDKPKLMMAAIPKEYVAGLSDAGNAGDKLWSDLNAMNDLTDPIVGGVVPLKQWLENAARHTKVFPRRHQFFRDLAEQVGASFSTAVATAISAPRIGKPPPPLSPQVASLLALLKETTASPARLSRVYASSLPDSARKIKETSTERLLQDLSDSRKREGSFPTPVIEFAERLARELKDAKLKSWVISATSNAVNERATLQNALDSEERAQRPKATIFVEIDGSGELSWWIQVPDLALCSPRETVSAAGEPRVQIAAHLPSILAQAEREVGCTYDPIISLILPDKLLSSDLESVTVQFEDDDLPPVSMPLNGRYPVTLHWNRRARPAAGSAGAPINSWMKALTTLVPRINAGGGANVEWLEGAGPEDGFSRFVEVADRLLSAHGTAVWVGLGYIDWGDSDRSSAEVVGCLRAGLPCFFWLSNPATGEASIRDSLCELFKRHKASDAPLSIGNLRKRAQSSDLVSSIHMVWDIPDYLPAVQMLMAPV